MTTHYMATIDGVMVTRSTAGRAYTHVKRAKPSKSKATR